MPGKKKETAADNKDAAGRNKETGGQKRDLAGEAKEIADIYVEATGRDPEKRRRRFTYGLPEDTFSQPTPPERDEKQTEIPCDIFLFMALTQDERMETVIRCAVDLGIYEIIPVEMKNCSVTTDIRKTERKRTGWQALCDRAADESERSFKPHVHRMMSFAEAILYARSYCDMRIVPYEKERDELSAARAFKKIQPGKSIGIFIGPENGFADDEIEALRRDSDLITLGKRVLRNETAAICTLYQVMMTLENRKTDSRKTK